MPRRNFVDTSEAPRPIRLDPTLAKRRPAADVIYYEAPKSHAIKFKLQLARQEAKDTLFPEINMIAQQPTKHKHDKKREEVADMMADDKAIDGLAEQLAAYSPLKPTKTWVLEKKEKVDPTGIWGWQEKFLPISRRKFKCFGRLPLELRLLIWEHSRPDPRIVQVAWSKHEVESSRNEWKRAMFPDKAEREAYFCEPDNRPNYSKTPIPSMLHACAESRKMALRWYQLALEPYDLEPRIYFDFSADYLYRGCELCVTDLCRSCRQSINPSDREKISKILCRWPWGLDPFFDLFLNFRGAKEILLIGAPMAGLVPSNIQLHDLKESTVPFEWQDDKTPYDIYLSHKEEYDSLVDKNNRGHRDYFDCYQSCTEIYFRPEKIIRVEIDFKPKLPEGSRVATITESPFATVK